MISPAKLDKLPAEVVNLVQELQEQIIRDVCRRVTKANYLTPTAEWQLYKANQLRLSYNEVNKRIARQLKVRERTIQNLYTETVKQALKEDADIYRIAAAEGKLPANTGAKIDSYFRSAALSKLLSKGLKNSKGQLRNLCNSMAAEANRALSDAMDLAHLKVISGAYSYDDAIYSAVKELSGKGITRVTYPSGRRDNVDVCVRRAVLSSVNKSCCDIQLDLAHEVGSKYVEVSSHFGARPSHAEWQGQIYSLEKGDPKYPYFYEATGYGTGEGLGGWNCRHNFFPYFEGIDTPYHTPNFSKTENNEYYALTQKQRGYERAVRDSKRKLAALDGARQSAEDPALRAKLDRDFARRAVTLKKREVRLENFIKDNDLQRDNARVRVVGFGKSVSRKAVWATTGANERYTKEDYINITKTKVSPDLYSNAKWRENFNRVSDNAAVNNSVRNIAQQILKHRDGTFYEDMYFINASTGAIEGFNTNDNIKCGVKINRSLLSALDKTDTELIGIHNHPYSSIPSLSDLNAIALRSNQSKGVIICHDGTIFTYTKPNRVITESEYKNYLTKFSMYSKMTMEDKGFQMLGEDFDFIFERIEL